MQKHPEYDYFYPDWVLMRDAYRGERQVKSRNTRYLPYTSGQIADGVAGFNQAGARAYEAYKTRARFPNFVREAVQTAVGMMHSQPPEIILPPELENIVSSKGENLYQLLRRINEEQLITGRVGLLLDLDEEPYIAVYSAERIINWDDGEMETIPQELNLVVLDESENQRAGDLSWAFNEKYRILVNAPYRIATDKEGTLRPLSFRGRTLDQIPFVVVNSCDVVVDPDEPPLLDLGNLCMTIYRGEADYRQNLFMQGQDTLVIVGGTQDEDESIRTGAGARIEVPISGDAKYIGVQSDGLLEQREALKEDRMRAGSMGAQSLDTVSRERESGASLNIRIAARTADLTQIAMTGAAGLEKLLRIAADWMGIAEQVSIKPNLEFGDMPLTGQTMVEMQTARNLGFPISAQSLHTVALERGITKLTFEQEQAQAGMEQDGVFKGERNGNRTQLQE